LQSLHFNSIPVMNWLYKLSFDILRDFEGKNRVTTTFAFKKPAQFHLRSEPIKLRGFQFLFLCSRKWFSQPVKLDLSLGQYDYTSQSFLIPSNQWISIGEVDNDKWEELQEPPLWANNELVPRPFFTMTTLNPLRELDGQGTPATDDLIGEREIKAE
jgi:hypothetical protein